MRKAIVLVLALVLAMSLALTAAAAPSAGNAEELPQQVVTAAPAAPAEKTVTVTADLTKLTAEQKTEVEEKGKAVEAALAEGEAVKLTAYVEGEGEAEVPATAETVELLQKGEMKLFQVGPDGKLVELKYEIVNGKVVVKNAIAGPIFFVGKK